jgi:hypothetical protein
MLTLDQIQNRVFEINKRIGLESSALPIFGFNYNNRSFDHDDRSRYVAIDKNGYSLIGFGHYRVKEHETVWVKTHDIEELLFEIFKDATRDIADKYVRDNHVPDQDRRTVLFQKHIEILQSLDLKKDFVDRLRLYYNNVLSIEVSRRK